MPETIINIFSDQAKFGFDYETAEVKKLRDRCLQDFSENDEVGKFYRTKVYPLLQATYQFKVATSLDPDFCGVRENYTNEDLRKIVSGIKKPLEEALQHVRILEKNNKAQYLVLANGVNYCSRVITNRFAIAEKNKERLYEFK